MPIIATFFGILVRMWHDDHPPPHIHVSYQGFEALVEIRSGQILEGTLPKKAAAIVKEWCLKHQNALLDNWARAQRFEPLERIPGADLDD
ncbi:DUF4160 domain-containing protein [Hydrogenophilus thermoluteolus]|uniref:DUF4160 domain-containing protein n=1 Tax=Hydrogenophilus thermoluteolus TaxID=297 RepID=A0A2Z6E0T5_HYDTE|nr:DUF4160 domain-containing protein [Hydrogenophilus thermoluteolus]MBW7656080.1 DUF4160 domain-containing protein [Hydrogenophilus thermoluteolus]BBD78238.1 hypothetical protein HPTL_1984 [Hydrogenophilus thermoluteolus]GLW61150.1 hypothetical protein Hthe01_14990 [Hydrogenophilus thermoluteolus]